MLQMYTLICKCFHIVYIYIHTLLNSITFAVTQTLLIHWGIQFPNNATQQEHSHFTQVETCYCRDMSNLNMHRVNTSNRDSLIISWQHLQQNRLESPHCNIPGLMSCEKPWETYLKNTSPPVLTNVYDSVETTRLAHGCLNRLSTL
jgi:hypothetical protein